MEGPSHRLDLYQNHKSFSRRSGMTHNEGKFKNVGDEKEQSSLLDPKFVDDKPSVPTKDRPVFRVAAPQVIAAMGFGFMVGSVAAICIMPTLVIGALYKNKNNTEDFELDEAQVSWYGSLSYLVQPIASICSGFTQNIFGRRRMMLAATIPLFASWIFLHFAHNVASLYMTQIIFGLSIGFMEAPSMSYLGEALQPRFRGTLSSLSEFLYIIGTVYLYVCGSVLDWRAVTICGAILPCITFSVLLMPNNRVVPISANPLRNGIPESAREQINAQVLRNGSTTTTVVEDCESWFIRELIFKKLPESPTWYIVKGRVGEAEKALRWLRGWVSTEEVDEEIRLLTKAVTDNPFSGAKIIEGEFSKVKNTPSQIALFKENRIWKPVLLVCIFFFAGNAGSLIGMRPTFISIFQELELPIPPKLVLVVSSAMNGIGCIVCVLSVHKTGKRFISIASLVMCAATCAALAAYVGLGVSFPWLATVLFALNFFSAGVGILTMPWVLVSECFPLEARGLSSGICAAGAYVSYFFFSKTYFFFEHLIAVPGVFILYGAISLAGGLYLYAFMPETEGKTLEEIEEAYQK